jgi:hypothetical protein
METRTANLCILSLINMLFCSCAVLRSHAELPPQLCTTIIVTETRRARRDTSIVRRGKSHDTRAQGPGHHHALVTVTVTATVTTEDHPRRFIVVTKVHLHLQHQPRSITRRSPPISALPGKGSMVLIDVVCDLHLVFMLLLLFPVFMC